MKTKELLIGVTVAMALLPAMILIPRLARAEGAGHVYTPTAPSMDPNDIGGPVYPIHSFAERFAPARQLWPSMPWSPIEIVYFCKAPLEQGIENCGGPDKGKMADAPKGVRLVKARVNR